MNEKTSKLAQRGFRALAAFVAAALILTCVPPTFRASAAAEPATGALAQPSEAGFAHDGPFAAGAASADDAASEPAEDAAPALGDDAASTDAGVAPDAPEDLSLIHISSEVPDSLYRTYREAEYLRQNRLFRR